MSKTDSNIITEEQKKTLRENAIVREFSRLSQSLRKKNKIINFYRAISVILLMVLCSFIYLNRQPVKETKSSIISTVSAKKKNTIVQQITYPSVIQPIKIYHTVFFVNDKNHPLAQFRKYERAKQFSEVLEQMDLPETQIVNDSIFRSRKQVKQKNFPYRYAVQLGAYKADVLHPFKDNLIWVINQADTLYNRYQIAPFNGYTKTCAFTNTIKLKEKYILPYN